jgi:urease accessory protein
MAVAAASPTTPGALAAYGGGWDARLDVALALRAGRTVATRVAHRGPLRLQKLLWPEGPKLAHLILLHPPSGVAAGDTLAFDLSLGEGTAALLTTPGAGRWYRADSPASQTLRVEVGPGARLEWLPQETILHDGLAGTQAMTVDVADDALAIGAEALVLGRRASGERLRQGHFRSRLVLRRGGRTLLVEDAHIVDPHDGLAGLGGAHVSALFWVVSPRPLDESDAAGCEEAVDRALGASEALRGWGADGTIAGASVIEPHLLAMRVVGRSPQTVRAAVTAAWSWVRPRLAGREAVVPRIWHT